MAIHERNNVFKNHRCLFGVLLLGSIIKFFEHIKYNLITYDSHIALCHPSAMQMAIAL
jgi:hypothetical protein